MSEEVGMRTDVRWKSAAHLAAARAAPKLGVVLTGCPIALFHAQKAIAHDLRPHHA